MIVLGERAFRSVVLDERDGAAVVAKRFHHPNPVLALFDGARARRERRGLVELERAGLPVPRPLALRERDGRHELELAAVEGARTLRDVLEGGVVEGKTGPPGGWARLAPRLGALLARLAASGWEHGDLHPGNVLVDARGAPWLVDLGGAHRAAPDAARALADLVHCAAFARELLAPRARARFLAAWLRELPPALLPALRGTALARAVERRARTRRARLVRTGLGRWLRESSRVRAFATAGRGAWARRGLAEERLAELAGGPEGRGARWLALRGDIALRGRREELRERWLGAARLAEHRIPAARPAVLAERSGWAAFEAPERGAATRAELAAALVDRGLVVREARVAEDAAGCWLLPPREDEIDILDELDG